MVPCERGHVSKPMHQDKTKLCEEYTLFTRETPPGQDITIDKISLFLTGKLPLNNCHGSYLKELDEVRV
jgi:hypothetical protein